MKETICKKVLDEKLAIEIADMLRTELPLKDEIYEDEETHYDRWVLPIQGEIIITIEKRTKQKRIIERRWRRNKERWDTNRSHSNPAKIELNNKIMVYNRKYYDVLKKYFRKREKENKEKWEIVRCFQERKNE